MATAHQSSSSHTTPESSAPDPPIQKSYSCVLCAQRKVKCDKLPGGCTNCAKARVSCIYKAPPPPRRRKKGVREVDVNTRLRLYEDALRDLGVDPEEIVKQGLKKPLARKDSVKIGDYLGPDLPEEAPKTKKNTDPGVLVSGEGKSRYLENGLWTSLKGEFRDSKEILDESSDDQVSEYGNTPSPEPFTSDGSFLLLGNPKSVTNLRPLHPQPVQIFKLWQTYIDNINPLVKLFHTPTVQQMILNASGNLDDIPKNVEALLFAIYCISLESLGEVECDAILGEPKSIVSPRFRAAAQHALINASFLKTSDLMVLQALTLFLLSLQNYNAQVIWILTGVAGRIAQRAGLHRDGEFLGLPPFEVEMRRRLWWQIMMVDGFAEKLAGTGGNVLMGDVRRPSNLNDSDLTPGMKELPKEHEGATEMMFFLIRCHVGEFLKRAKGDKSNFDGVWNKLSTNAVDLTVKDRAIDELDALFKRKYTRFCDRSIPWHWMCIHLTKAVVFMMRFMAHNTEYLGTSAPPMPQSEKDMLFTIALQVTTYQNMAYTTKEMQGFLWHINLHFQWKSFIYLISELRYRTEGTEVDDAWKQVQGVFDFHPNFAKEVSRRALPIAVGNLTLKAWDAYLAARGKPEGGEPYFIHMLRTRCTKAKPPSISPSQESEPSLAMSLGSNSFPQTLNYSTIQPQTNTDPLQSLQWNSDIAASLDVPTTIADLTPLDPEQMNWSNWDNLLANYQMNDSTHFPGSFSGFDFGL